MVLLKPFLSQPPLDTFRTCTRSSSWGTCSRWKRCFKSCMSPARASTKFGATRPAWSRCSDLWTIGRRSTPRRPVRTPRMYLSSLYVFLSIIELQANVSFKSWFDMRSDIPASSGFVNSNLWWHLCFARRVHYGHFSTQTIWWVLIPFRLPFLFDRTLSFFSFICHHFFIQFLKIFSSFLQEFAELFVSVPLCTKKCHRYMAKIEEPPSGTSQNDQ